MLRHVVQLHAEAQVGLVRAVAAQRVLVIEMAERALRRARRPPRRRAPSRARSPRKYPAGAETTSPRSSCVNSGWRSARKSSSRKQRHDLEVAVHAGNHQDLLEDLRRLRQRVELPVMNAARDEIIARAFGRRAREHRRLDLEKALLVERLANFENDAVAQLDIASAAAAAADRDSGSAGASLRSRSLRLRSRMAASSRCSGCAGAWPALRLRPWRFRDSTSAGAARALRPRPQIPSADSSAFACASGCSSLLNTICAMPARSRRSMKMSWPRSRRRCTQPIRTTSLSASDARSAPQYCVRFRFPRVSSNGLASE